MANVFSFRGSRQHTCADWIVPSGMRRAPLRGCEGKAARQCRTPCPSRGIAATHLQAVCDDDRLDIADQAVWSRLRGPKQAKVVDTIETEQTGHAGLVDGRARRRDGRRGGVGDTVGESGGDLGARERRERQRGERRRDRGEEVHREEVVGKLGV